MWPCAYTEQQKVELLHVHASSRGLNAYCFAFFFHHLYLKQVSSLWSSAPCICIFFVGGFALKVFPEHGTEVLSSVPKHKKTVVPYRAGLLEKLPSGMCVQSCWERVQC